MPKIENVRPLRRTDNVSFLNAIRADASSDYRQRIPEATASNITDTINNLLSYRATRNEFLDSLVNKIGLTWTRGQNWSNPYAKFKRGMLEFGDTIEEVQIGLAQAYVYDPQRDYLERDIFGQEPLESQSSFHKVNRENFYKITINDRILKRAFNSDYGLSDLVSEIMGVPNTSDQWDEYLLTTRLFREYYDQNGFFKINVPNVSDAASDAADAKAFLRRVREMAETLPFLSRHYNAAKMPVATTADQLELFLTPEANAAIDVEALAAAFNVDRANMPTRINIIPREHFNIPGAEAILTTRDFFVIADTLFETTSTSNPAGLYDNYFLHHHQIVSASRFVPAILFTSTEATTVIPTEETPVVDLESLEIQTRDGDTVTELTRGETYQVLGSAITDPAGGLNDGIVLTLTGALSERTYLTQTGALHVSIDEAADSLTVTATSNDDETFSEDTVLTVTGDRVELWPLNVTPDAEPEPDPGV